MKRMAVLILACVGAVPLLHALTETVDGVTWGYEIRTTDYDAEGNAFDVGYSFAAICSPHWPIDENAAIPTSMTGEVTIPKEIQGYKVRHIGNFAFLDCADISALTVPESITYIGYNAFLGATRLRDITFLGDVPIHFSAGDFPEEAKVFFPKRYAANWEKALAGSPHRGGLIENRATPIITAAFPVTAANMGGIQIPYAVTSAHGYATVEVYPIAFREGKRAIENLVFPSSVSGCGTVDSGVEQTLTWNWQSDLSDMTRARVELLVRDGAVLPKETVEIPSVDLGDGGYHQECTVTRNGLSESQAFNALLWYLAKKDDTRLAISGNAILIDGKKVYEDGDFGFDDTLLLNYLYGKEGYAVIDTTTLDYVEQVLGTVFPRSGLGQIAIKQQ